MKSLSVVAIALLCGCSSANTSTTDFEENTAGDSSTTDESGSKNDSSITDKDAGTEPTSDTAMIEETKVSPDTAPPPLTLDNVCARIADMTCTTSYASCCGSKGFPFKESGCRAAVLAACGEETKAIAAGKGTFNAGAFPACAKGWNDLATKCTVPLLEYVEAYTPCQQLLNGGTAPGSACDSDNQCKAGEGAYADCGGDGRCETTAIVGKDAACVYSGSTRAICDYGLACNFSSSSMGKCVPAKPIGASCNNSLECGFGNWCERGLLGGGKCAVGRAAGAGCAGNEECASGGCVSNKCTDPNATPAIRVLCNGTTG